MSLLAYLGPETMLPMTSVLAGLLGFFMMFGRKVYGLMTGLVRKKPGVVTPKTRARGHRPTASRTTTSVSQRTSADRDETDDSFAA